MKPWETEPNKVQWVDEATNLDCLAVRGPHHAWCGYVGVPKSHPLFGKEYESGFPALDVHGGVTFTDKCDEAHPEGICHVPQPGRPVTLWWIGFDCAHSGDFMPHFSPLSGVYYKLATLREPLVPAKTEVYRTLDFVRAECAQLAAQIRRLAP